MHEAVIKVFNDHPDKTATIPLFFTKVSQVKDLHALIKATDLKIVKLDTGVTDAKKSAKTELGSTAHAISQSLLEYANEEDNEELAGAMKFNATDFRRFSDSEMETRATAVLDKLRELLPFLGDLNLKQPDVDDLQAKLDLYVAKKTNPRNRSNVRKELNASMEGYFRRMTKLLESCDRYALRMKKDFPEFFNVYTAARVIVDRGGSHASNGSNGVNDAPVNQEAATPVPAPMPG